MLPMMLFLVLVLGAQAQPTAPKAVRSLEDVVIGMPADLPIAGLTKEGYTLKDLYAGYAVGDSQNWSVFYKDKPIGSFSVEKGHVTAAEQQVYDSQDPATGSGDPIGLAEALFWILVDNGSPVNSVNRTFRQMGTDAQFTTREIETRAPGESMRMIFMHLDNGAHYRIDLSRNPGGLRTAPRVTVFKLAPFVKAK
jgi:hypothetical protein